MGDTDSSEAMGEQRQDCTRHFGAAGRLPEESGSPGKSLRYAMPELLTLRLRLLWKAWPT